jgi:hypothetical protein
MDLQNTLKKRIYLAFQPLLKNKQGVHPIQKNIDRGGALNKFLFSQKLSHNLYYVN